MAYEEILDRIVESDTLVTVSMGNAGGWADYALSGVPYLYGDDVSLSTGGSPASYTNGLSVAAVDNGGYTGQYLAVGEDLLFYMEATDYGNAPIATLAGEHEYVFIDGIGTEEEWAALSEVVAGKIAVCARGETSFFEKANAAVANGAIATIIYNNVSGELNMDLTGYSYSAPCVAITLRESEMLRNAATAVTAEDGTVLYYTGKLTVAEAGDIEAVYRDPEYFVMSSFSSWGVAGTLELKPEITAPGGNIYGVNGQDPSGTAYETMSGTSMSAPQVAGMAALVGQYIREKGLDEKTGLSPRHLIQSLLMSTAIPLREEANDGYYWSVLKQGAGLADVGAAISAKSYIKMADDATASAADYKVKAELGHDPQRKGSYTFGFSIHNFSETAQSYTLSGDFFTQDLFEQEGQIYLDTQTVALPVRVAYVVDGVTFVPTAGIDCDLDLDGDTDADDAQMILDYAVGNLEALDEQADVDGDSRITTYDAYQTPVSTQVFSAYFNESYGTWRNEYYVSTINRTPENLGLEEDERVTVTVLAVPEYFEKGGNLTAEDVLALHQEGTLGSGAYLSTTLTVDDTAPVVTAISKDMLTGALTITASDNNYISAIQVVNRAGSKLFGSALPAAEERGQTVQTTIDLSGMIIGPECLVVVADYADNYTVYEVAYGGETEDYTGRMFGFTGAYARGSGPRWVELNKDEIWYNRTDGVGGGMETAAAADYYFTAAEYVDGRLFAASTDGYLYTTLHGEGTDYQKVGDFSGTVETIMDMALNYRDDQLYALGSDNVLYTVDLVTGALTRVASITLTHPDPYSYGPYDLQTLAIDNEGNFYTINYGGSSSAYLYSFTLEDVVDGAITDLPPVNSTQPLGVWSYSNESMAWDHDNDILYLTSAWGSYPSMDIDNKLWTVDTETGLATRTNETFAGDSEEPERFAGILYDQVVGLYIVPAGAQVGTPTDTATGIALNRTEVTMLKGGKEILVADVYPWTLTDKTVTWTSSDPSVVTVDNGLVTAVGVGTATITVTTNAAPGLSATCEILVEKVPEIQLSGLIHDAEGKPTWAEFSTDAPADYTAVGEGSAYIAGGLLEDRIFVHDGTAMYGIDGDTFAATSFGEISPVWAWSDAAEAPAGEEGMFGRLVAICNDGTYVELIDPDAGTLTYWDLTNSFASDPMAVLAHVGTGTYDYDLWFEYYPNCPANFYYMMTESGSLWYVTVFTFNEGESYSIAEEYLGETGISLSGVASKSGSYASLVYDKATGYLALSRYNGGDSANLFAIDPDRMLVADLGTFGSDVWPVVSLYQYRRVTELTLRMSQETASIYMGDAMQLSVRIKPSSFTGGVTWSSGDESVAIVDENGVVSSVSPGNAVITATSVDTSAAGEKVSVTCDVTILDLLAPNASINAQVETAEGLHWATIDLSNRSITNNAEATTRLSGAGYSNGKIYGSDGDYEHACRYYMVDPANGFAETTGTESHASYTMLDSSNSPAVTVDLYGDMYPVFGETMFLAEGERLSMLNFEAGTAIGWTISYYDVNDAGAIAFLGHSYDEYGSLNYHYAALNVDGDLYQLVITPSYYDSWSERVEYMLSVSSLGNIGQTFESKRTLSMACVRNENGVHGLVISDSYESPTSLYFVDLTAETLSCGKIGKLEGVTHVSGLYGELDLATELSDSTLLGAAAFAVRAGTEETNSSPLALHQAPAYEQRADFRNGLVPAAANAAEGSVHGRTRNTEVAEEDDLLTLSLSETVDAANGLLTVSYDPTVLRYEGMTSSLSNTAVRVDAEAGIIVFAYAAATPVTAGTALANLRFRCLTAHVDSTVLVETAQRDADLDVTGQVQEIAVSHEAESLCRSLAFADLDPAQWYHAGVDFALNNGLMKGMSDTEFAPNGNVTRAQLVTILYRLAGKPSTEGMENPFKDVAEGTWYTEAVIWAAGAGVVKGIDDSTFAPNAAITREQIATILFRYTGAEAVAEDHLKDFTDADRISAYAVEAMNWAVANGLVKGMGDDTVAPGATATRAQIATILMRYCGE